MEQYIECKFVISPPQPWSEILMAELISIGFDSFLEESDGVIGYVPKAVFQEELFSDLLVFGMPDVVVSYSFRDMPNINWNEEWERNFEPIDVEDRVFIRAEFHDARADRHEIVIQPKMSFGTGHHPTTYLMIKEMLCMDFAGRVVLDMGCGTSVLGIFAKQLGASRVVAVDIDEWSVENSRENALRNGVDLDIYRGTADSLGDEVFDVILANINRNILVSDIPVYVSVLRSGGELLLSGLCFFDVDDILDVCFGCGLELICKQSREEWISLRLRKL